MFTIEQRHFLTLFYQTKALEENLRKHREQLTKTHNEFRQRWAAANTEKKSTETEKQALQTAVSELRNEIQVMTVGFNGQLDALRSEKMALEKTLEVERSSKPHDSGSDQQPIIVCFRILPF
jgi:peptidoglycan hydrolase CwlO-like protein